MLRTLAVATTGLAAVACVPQVPFSPIAVELVEPDKVKILQTDCTLEGVVKVEVIAVNDDQTLDDKDTSIWQVAFKSPAKVRAFETGVVPEGGEELVPWLAPGRDQPLVARIQTASGLDFTEDFSVGGLEGDKVRYHLKTMSRDEFGKEAPCAVK
ncbi:hypothetical protein C8D87_11867 [Lentzea atacamensis]|uniref:Lipoprotein n=1 Tax=Lentzea atacamensis TaxID=531938 RepID=A0ABX9DY95_9PSEU|nr:hypothetical protein [Lentzea atacamensis]RAS58112.1 hypothetical protein C8D87_11867 [Lentzea atacamensis]